MCPNLTDTESIVTQLSLMRITNRLFEQSITRNLSNALERVNRTLNRVTTGLRVEKPSDDPQAAGTILRIDHSMRALDQYRRHSAAGRARLNAEESAMQQVNDLLTRARELALSGGSDSASPAAMNASAAEVDQIISQVVQLGNTRVANEYIFAGAITDSPPFQPDGTYTGDTTTRQVEIDDGILLTTNHTGDQAFVTSNTLNSLTLVRDALRTGDPSQVRAVTAELDTATDNVQTVQAEVGARLLTLDSTAARLADRELNLTTERSDVAEVDFEKATTEFLTAQTVLQAARAAASRVLEQTLTNFLR